MFVFLIQNFELTIFVIAMVIFVEFLVLACIALNIVKQPKKRRTQWHIHKHNDRRQEFRPIKEDDYGLTILDLEGDDFNFDFL